MAVNQAPALMRLALDIGLAGLALGVEGVELKVEVMLGRIPGVDRHRSSFLPGLSMARTRLVPAVRLSSNRGAAAFGGVAACGGDGFGICCGLASILAGTRKPKKRGPFRGAGNSPRDSRKTSVRAVVPKEAVGHNGNGMAFALVFADQDGAGLQAAVQLVRLLAASQPVRSFTVSWSRPRRLPLGSDRRSSEQ